MKFTNPKEEGHRSLHGKEGGRERKGHRERREGKGEEEEKEEEEEEENKNGGRVCQVGTEDAWRTWGPGLL